MIWPPYSQVFPIVNTSNDNAGVEKGKELTDQQLKDKAKEVETATQETWLEIDGQVMGKQVSDFAKMLSGVQGFAYEVPNTPKNIYRSLGMDWAGKVPVSFADGYWATLAPLPAGNHTIHFKAKVKPAGADPFELDVLYDVMVGGAEQLAPAGKPYGKSFAEWGAAWWKWVYESPGPAHPILDATGDACQVGQSGDVFFLAGTLGCPAERHCNMPSGKAIFFPIVNNSSDNVGAEAGKELTDQQLQDKVKTLESVTKQLRLWVDGELVGDGVTAFKNNLGGVQGFSYQVPDTATNIYKTLGLDFKGKVDKAYSNGYWAVLAPLAVGSHTVRFAAHVEPAGDKPFDIDVTYHLHVGGFSPVPAGKVLWGKTYAEWAAKWWQWVYQNPGPDHPVLDDKGDKCMVGQTGDVLMLAGNFGGPTVRTCTMPAGKPLFFPLLNSSADNAGVEVAKQKTDQQLKDAANAVLTEAKSLSLWIDGTLVGGKPDDFKSYTSGLQKFTYTVPDTKTNIYRTLGMEFAGPVDPAYTNGYWMMLEPLPAGMHVVRFAGKIQPASGNPFELDSIPNPSNLDRKPWQFSGPEPGSPPDSRQLQIRSGKPSRANQVGCLSRTS